MLYIYVYILYILTDIYCGILVYILTDTVVGQTS